MRALADPFLLLLLATLALASLLPASGEFARTFDAVTDMGVALLFFLHGAALPREAVLGGLTQWRLHLFIFAVTFGLFPLLVSGFGLVPSAWLPPDMLLGFLYLGALPSTVSSSIAFTAIAKGNVPAAVCSAAASNLFGMVLTPLLVALLAQTSTTHTADIGASLRSIVVQLLLPFAAGQAVRPWLADALVRHKKLTSRVDRGIILMVVYAAFSQSVVEGIWNTVPPLSVALALALCTALLLFVLAGTQWLSRRLGFSRPDEIAAVFCGSKKSLASGLPFAKVLFAGAPGFGLIVLPIMMYHQIQLLVCALLAQRYARSAAAPVAQA